MRVLIVGANGNIGRLLVARIGYTEHGARAMIRDAAQAPQMRALGAEAVVADLEADFDRALVGCDAVVFTAGSGPHTGPGKTLSVDRDGAIRLIDSAVRQRVRRFVMVSALRTRTPEHAPEKLRHYLAAKHAADEHLMASGLDWTVVRPGRLTDEPGSGQVHAFRCGPGVEEPRYGEIPRADVAEALAVILDVPATIGREIGLIAGDTAVEAAIRGL